MGALAIGAVAIGRLVIGQATIRRLRISELEVDQLRLYRLIWQRTVATQVADARFNQVRIDIEASPVATVVEVHARDGLGILYRITGALADLDLDIVSAKVQTLGADVVDSFYVRSSGGAKPTDPAVLAEVERALLHALDSP